jgi:hypothetical protein
MFNKKIQALILSVLLALSIGGVGASTATAAPAPAVSVEQVAVPQASCHWEMWNVSLYWYWPRWQWVYVCGPSGSW